MIDPLIVDVYPLDGKKDWGKYIAAGPPWHGAIFKLTQGLRFAYTEWAHAQRAPFLASSRYGVDLFDGFYHYLDLSEDGDAQAVWFWEQMTAIGGELPGTLWAMVDVERGGQRAIPSKALFDECVGAFSARYHALSGRLATLYGGELLRAYGEHGLMGCGRSVIAAYGKYLNIDIIRRTGTTPEQLLAWQYTGTDPQDPEKSLSGYPLVAPGCGKVDTSVLTLPGGLAAVRSGIAPPSSCA